MIRFESIRKRVVKAYLLFAVAFSLFFAVVSAVVVEGIEQRLVFDRLQEVAAWAAPRHADKLNVAIPAGMSFHHADDIPVPLRGLGPGIHEATIDGVGLHVFSGRDARGPFVVVDSESDYEQIELAVYSMLALILFGFIALSVMLGRFIAGLVVTPIVDLSAAVAERKAHLPLLENHDELGILARSFAARTDELNQFLERERAFTGDVSHELRTALTVISGAAELLVRDRSEQPHAHAAAERIHRAAREAAESVNILLLLARTPELIETERIELEPLLVEEVERYQSLVAGKPVRLLFEGGDNFTIRAQRRLVVAAVGNLIRNACLYTDQGEVSVLMEGRSVVVRDTGRGLPAAVLVMLSSDANRQPLRGSEGTGLGLALVKRICFQLGATLTVAPIDGGGTVFAIHFSPD